MKNNFMAVTLRSRVASVSLSKKLGPHQELLEFILENMNKHVPFDPNTAIDTESNLSSAVLQEIMQTINLKYDSSWQQKSQLIDRDLLKIRNEIVHGELIPVDKESFQQLYDFVIQSLERYKTCIENAAALSDYQKVV